MTIRFYYIGRRFFTETFLRECWKNHDIDKIINECSWIVDYSIAEILKINAERPGRLVY